MFSKTILQFLLLSSFFRTLLRLILYDRELDIVLDSPLKLMSYYQQYGGSQGAPQYQQYANENYGTQQGQDQYYQDRQYQQQPYDGQYQDSYSQQETYDQTVRPH